MVRLIMGVKGSGKTKQLIEMINNTAKDEAGNVVCIEANNNMMYDIHYHIRLIDAQEYKLNNAEAFRGFICGLFAADTVEGLDVLAEHVMGTLSAAVKREPDLTAVEVDEAKVAAVSEQLKSLYGEGSFVCFLANQEIKNYDPATKSLSPDHIVYAKAKQLTVCDKCDLAEAFAAFEAENGYKPKIIFFKGLGMFACGMNENEAKTASIVMLDAIKVVAYTEAFGGVSAMPDFLIDFIVNWEVESYRSKVSLSK